MRLALRPPFACHSEGIFFGTRQYRQNEKGFLRNDKNSSSFLFSALVQSAKVFSILLMMFLAACSHEESEQAQDAPPPVVEVKIDSIRVGAIPEIVRATGMTKVLRQENISSPIEGKITSLKVLEGEAVKPGEVIAMVETKESLATLTGAELLLARANNSEDKTRAEAALARARQNRTAVAIRAPFNGVVITRTMNEGEFVAAGGTLVTVIDLSSLRFMAKLPARELSRIKLGQEAKVSFQSWPDKIFRCRVENLKPQIDPLAQMAEARLRFLSISSELRSEMFGQAEIIVGQHNHVFLVPDKAVVRDDETGTHTIVEAVGDSIGVIREVEAGIETPTTMEISREGLRAGMHIIVEGHYGLPDSTHIHIINEKE